ncbi:hypothetical protein D3C78_994960 [compost metagenome]
MKNNIFMALATAVLNAFALVATPLLGKPEHTQSLMALSGIISPFLSIYLLKLYIKADDPAELTRTLGALESSIKICKKHLKDKNSTPEFKNKTRKQMEEFQTKLQNVRSDFESGRAHVITPIASISNE